MEVSEDEQVASDLLGEIMGEGVAYDPAGLAAKYGVDDVDWQDSESGDSDYEDKSEPRRRQSPVVEPRTSSASRDPAGNVTECSPDMDDTSGCYRADEGGRNAMRPAVEELQSRNAILLEAVEKKSRQVRELGTILEALEPVPGLDPEAFFSVLRGPSGKARKHDVDYRDVKIVQLAKRSRATSARLEGERARCQKAHREIDILAKELEACRRELDLVSSAGARVAAKNVRQDGRAAELQPSTTSRKNGNEERLRQQTVLLRNKLQEAQEEAKKAHRQAGRNDVDSQAHEEIHFMERQRGHAMEQLEEKFHELKEEVNALRGQTVAKGARVAGLEKANVRLRDRVKLLLAKSDTDDRLVDALRCELQTVRKTGGLSR